MTTANRTLRREAQARQRSREQAASLPTLFLFFGAGCMFTTAPVLACCFLAVSLAAVVTYVLVDL